MYSLTAVIEIFIIFFILLFIGMFIMTFYYRKRHVSITNKLEDSYHRNRQMNDFMKFFSDTLSSTDKLDEVYSSIAKRIADITDAKGICIYELQEDNFLIPVGYTESFPPLQRSSKFILSKPRYATDSLKYEKIRLGEGIIGETAQNKSGILLHDAYNDSRLKAANTIMPIHTLMVNPMKIGEEVTGVICAINNKSNKPFSINQFDFLESMTKLIVLIHNILKVYKNLATQQRFAQELEFTRLLQKSLLPREFPEWKPFVIHAFTRSAKEVGGDFYDFVEIDNDRLLVVIGDASGKGVPACMVMAMARSFLRANIERFTTLSSLMEELNKNLYRDTNEGRFITLSCCLLDKKENTVEFARAGHTELLLYSNKNYLRQFSPHGTALGLLPKEFAGSYDTFAFTFKQDFSIMLFSDGITESMNSLGEEFGIDKLTDIFLESSKRKNTPNKCTNKVFRTVDEFTEGEGQSDDQTLIIISHESLFI